MSWPSGGWSPSAWSAGRSPQRRFSCDEERDFTLRHLDESGLDVTGREAEGTFHTEFYLSRPAAEVAERPLSELLPGLAGGMQRV